MSFYSKLNDPRYTNPKHRSTQELLRYCVSGPGISLGRKGELKFEEANETYHLNETGRSRSLKSRTSESLNLDSVVSDGEKLCFPER